MDKQSHARLSIVPEQIMNVLRGEHLFDSDLIGGVEITCENVSICKVDITGPGKYKITAVACIHPRHNTVVDLYPLSDRSRKILSKVQGRSTCPMCNGTKWIDPSAAETRQVVLFAASLGIFRGIKIPKENSGEFDGSILSPRTLGKTE